MNIGIYKITNKINGKFYIGSTSNKLGFNKRWQKHKRELNINKHSNLHLQNAWNKYGETSFSFEILETCEKEKCIEKEQFYIDTLNPQYNICKIAGSTLGKKHSIETRIKIGKNRNYGPAWNKGKNMSGEYKIAMSKCQKESKICQERILALNKTKQKPVIGIHIETGEIIELDFMSQNSNFHGSGIKASILNKTKSYKKYKWYFKN